MYPKDFYTNNKLLSDPGLCFVLMPFAQEFNDVWTTVRDTVTGEPFNLICRKANDISQPGQIMTDVLRNIEQASIVIADLSGQNANVFYELGIAHTVKDARQVILLAADTNDIPFDLRSLRYILYSDDMKILAGSLSSAISEIGIRQFAISLRENESGIFPRLTGTNNCLFEIGVYLEYVGVDGAKIIMKLTKFEAGDDPRVVHHNGYYLGVQKPAMEVPNLPWSMCYTRLDNGNVKFILGRAPGWQP